MNIPVRFSYYKFLRKVELLKSILVSTEELITEKINAFEEKVKKEAETMKPESAEQYYEYMSSDHHEVTNEIPETFRISQFVGVATFLETELMAIAQQLFKKDKLQELLKESPLKGVPKSEKISLIITDNLELTHDSGIWDDLRTLIWLRNEYAHNSEAMLDYKKLEADAFEIAPSNGNHESYSLDSIKSKLKVARVYSVVPESSLIEDFIDKAKIAIDPIYKKLVANENLPASGALP